MPTIYYEAGLPATLIPVQFIGWAKTPLHDITGLFDAVVRLKRSSGAYKRGEVLHVPPDRVVEKTGQRDYFIRVRQAKLPARDDSKLIPSRC